MTEASRRLLDDPDANIESDLRRIEAASKLVKHMSYRRSAEPWLAPVVALLCVGIAGLLWSLRVSEPRIALHLTSEAVALELAAPFRWSNEAGTTTALVRVEGLTSVAAPMLGLSIGSERDDVWLESEGGHLSLGSLRLEAGGVLALEHLGPSETDLIALNLPLEAKLHAMGRLRLVAGNDTAEPSFDKVLDLTTPESIAVRAQGKGVLATRIVLQGDSAWVARELPVSGLVLSRQVSRAPGEFEFESSLLRGSVMFHDTGANHTLGQKQRLTLRGVKGRILELNAGAQIELIFDGTAEQVLVGPPGHERDLRPTWLAYLYNNQPLAFFWSAAAFLWGFLWSGYNLIFASSRR